MWFRDGIGEACDGILGKNRVKAEYLRCSVCEKEHDKVRMVPLFLEASSFNQWEWWYRLENAKLDATFSAFIIFSFQSWTLQGSAFYGCRTCDYDECQACAMTPRPAKAQAPVFVLQIEGLRKNRCIARCQKTLTKKNRKNRKSLRHLLSPVGHPVTRELDQLSSHLIDQITKWGRTTSNPTPAKAPRAGTDSFIERFWSCDFVRCKNRK